MFWKKSSPDYLVDRNPRFAHSFGFVYNEIIILHMKIDESFEDYLSNKKIMNALDIMHHSTTKAAKDLGALDVLFSVRMQLVDTIEKRIDKDDYEQVAWSFNVGRDIIFSYAPAIASVGKKDVFQLTHLFIQSVLDEIEARNFHQYQKFQKVYLRTF